MRPPKAYRPSLADHLETRVVPSQAALGPAADVAAVDDARDDEAEGDYATVRQEFGAFLRGYFRAVNDVLLDRDDAGRIAPEAHRDAFDAAIDRALEDMTTHLDASGAALPAEVRGALTGDGGDSLRDRLAALPTPTGDQDSTPRMFTQDAFQVIARTLSDVTDALLHAR